MHLLHRAGCAGRHCALLLILSAAKLLASHVTFQRWSRGRPGKNRHYQGYDQGYGWKHVFTSSGGQRKSGSARLGKAADAGVLHFTCFALLKLIGIHGHCCHLLLCQTEQWSASRLFLLPSCGIRARSDKILAAVLAFEQLLRTRGGAGFLATPTADSLSSCCALRNSLGEASTYPFPSFALGKPQHKNISVHLGIARLRGRGGLNTCQDGLGLLFRGELSKYKQAFA